MKRSIILTCSILAILSSCKDVEKKEENIAKTETEEKMTEDKQEEWQELFNGENLDGWKAYNSDKISEQWKVEDGAIVFSPMKKVKGSENLITTEEFESFELSLEWKISEGGNSGIMWAVQEKKEFGEPYITGPEIQVLDNKRHPDAKNGEDRTAGALYDLVAPSQDVSKAAGEWNKEVIHIDYENNTGWVELNGTKIVEFPLHGEKWQELVNNSKFKDWKEFGTTRKGHIALQDHGDKVWFRNLKIRKL
ncbi:DUF1080 domain-containing protein [Gramella sp. GC03-9]|uniref:DUF1080 domain-containing protein n=1 Tax=Christiangramia oceanisediminis TaxID=2920386 RepID=A0A9X2I9U3_9FLAO|nr:DUF1080 domain-containing protein [Gramella oceanisediminis]MCP9200061.1 DUF1080 domain-containing protein [Gramella oceanisediminis]